MSQKYIDKVFLHTLMENRNGLVLDARATPATGTAEREAAADMILNIRAQDGCPSVRTKGQFFPPELMMSFWPAAKAVLGESLFIRRNSLTESLYFFAILARVSPFFTS